MADARELYKQGFEHYANDRYEEAIASYRAAVEADPELSIAWNGLAMAFSRQGDANAAIEAGLKLVELEPNDPLSYTSLSIFYQQAGMIPEAEDAKAKAMRLTMAQQ